MDNNFITSGYPLYDKQTGTAFYYSPANEDEVRQEPDRYRAATVEEQAGIRIINETPIPCPTK